MKYKWLIKESSEISEDFLKVAFNSEVIARLLINRGINSCQKAIAYLDPKFYVESKPEEIPHLLKAKDRIIEAINKNENITIFGDYDVDGVTSTSCLLITLRQFTDNVDFYIPSRLTEGYGLNTDAVKAIKKKHKAKLLITCDCGITNFKETELANELGMDVIITDHHSLPEILPPAYAVLNPKLLPSDHELHFLPGVGVAYKLCEAILEQEMTGPIRSSNLLDLVTLGMIADLAPLVDENRYLVQIGLPQLANTQKVGLQELLRICGIAKDKTSEQRHSEAQKHRGTEAQIFSTEHIGFGIAPRINAVGRLTDASLAVKLFTTDNLLEAIQISTELDLQNKQRQSICEETLNEAVTLVSEQVDLQKDKCIVLAKENWHHGVLGIVASRVLEKFHLPTILIGIEKEQNIARGSGRSIEALNITEMLSVCSPYLEKFGGHKVACGLSVKPENISDFIFAFKDKVSSTLNGSDLSPVLKIDCELPLSCLSLDLINKINKLAPFGLSNPMPVFESEEVEIVSIRNIGKNGQHLKLMLKNVIARDPSLRSGQAPQSRSNLRELDRDCFAPYGARNFEALIWNHDPNVRFNTGDKLKVAYTPKLNNYNGETAIQLEVKDWQFVEQRAGDGAMGREGEKVLEVFDYRGRTEECINVLSDAQKYSSTEVQIIHFAEVLQKDFLPLKTYSRHKITKCNSLIFLETPPDENIFLEIIRNSQANKIYLAFSQSEVQRHRSTGVQEILKNLIGMLRYTISNKSSRVSEVELQSALGVNKIALAYAMETLVKIGLLSHQKNGVDCLNINISKPSRQDFSNLIEYNLFVSELSKINKFRDWLMKANIEEVVALLEKNKLEIKLNFQERVLSL